MWRWTVSPENAPDAAEYLDIEFKNGDIVALNGTAMSPATVLTKLNELGGKHGIGRLDLLKTAYVGMSRAAVTKPRRHHYSQGTPRYRVHHFGSRSRAFER